uniref:Flavonoid-3'-hydroxylase n=1 Tax=Iris hollandica TaxID=35876 RepID=W8REB2_IRIHO|nr:flavonoid-3'-hydroxylase [Iris x hollandica]
MVPLLLLQLFFTLIICSIGCYVLFGGKSSHAAARLPPGPRGWPVLGNLPQLGTKPHQTLAAMSKLYGPLFRLRFGSVDVVVAASSTVAAQFLRTYDANFSNRPPNSGAEHVAYNYQDLVFAPYGPRWRMLRKLCALHLFSLKALDDLRLVRQGEVAALAANLHRHAANGHPPVNLGRALNVCATNALARAMLGRKVFTEEEGRGEADEFKEMVVELMKLAGVFNVGDFVPWLGWLDLQGVVGKMKRLHRRYDTFFDRVIEEHQSVAKAGAPDLLSVLIRLKEDADGDGGKLTNTDIKALLLNLFTAGTDTSSSTVEWALVELIRHPDILRKAQEELDSVVGRERLVSESDLPNLPVLQAVVKETLRLHPSTPLSLPRMSSEECVIGGYRIPKHATPLVNVWAIGRDPSVWTDPLEFRPARFLPGGEREHVDVRGNDFEVIPFGAGRRICAGMSLGIRMVQLMTATIVHAFDWTLPGGFKPEHLDMEEAYGLTLQRAVPLDLHPVPRLLKQSYLI